jgi:hypothetical protein
LDDSAPFGLLEARRWLVPTACCRWPQPTLLATCDTKSVCVPAPGDQTSPTGCGRRNSLRERMFIIPNDFGHETGASGGKNGGAVIDGRAEIDYYTDVSYLRCRPRFQAGGSCDCAGVAGGEDRAVLTRNNVAGWGKLGGRMSQECRLSLRKSTSLSHSERRQARALRGEAGAIRGQRLALTALTPGRAFLGGVSAGGCWGARS